MGNQRISLVHEKSMEFEGFRGYDFKVLAKIFDRNLNLVQGVVSPTCTHSGPLLDMGGFAKLVTGFLILCRCRFEKSLNVHFFRKLIAHRVCPNFSISGIKLHRTTRLYFLTDPKNIETKKS